MSEVKFTTVADKALTWYLSGPMTGYPQFNIPEFKRITDIARCDGYTIISPAELDALEVNSIHLKSKDGKMDQEQYIHFLIRDIGVIALNADGLILMDNWEESKGARLEVFTGLMFKKQFAVWYKGCFPKMITVDEVRKLLKHCLP
jgi:hypothetical protein